jgi:hypothetical protein
LRDNTLIKLADGVMKRNGQIIKAIADTGRDLPPLNIDQWRKGQEKRHFLF